MASKYRPFVYGLITGSAACGTVLSGFMFGLSEKKEEQSPTISRVLKYGVPDKGPELSVFENHVLSYDRIRKTPIWVAEHITKDMVQGEADRAHSQFIPDPTLPRQHSAENDDYFRSGWSRGHMVPAGDFRHSQKAMNETFFLSNIVPQNLHNNGRYWNLLEKYCRELTKRYDNVYIFSGPLYLPRSKDKEKDATKPKTYVKYQVIGQNQVAVPTHLFKVVIADKKPNGSVLAAAFVIPNAPVEVEKSLTDFQVTLDDLEKMSGIRFAPKLNDEVTKSKIKIVDLCTVDGCKLMEAKEFYKMVFGRNMKSARKMFYLEKTWKEAQQKEVADDQGLKEIYESSKKRLSDETEDSDENLQRKTAA